MTSDNFKAINRPDRLTAIDRWELANNAFQRMRASVVSGGDDKQRWEREHETWLLHARWATLSEPRRYGC